MKRELGFFDNFSKEKILFVRTEDLKSIEKDVFASINIFLDINKFYYETKMWQKAKLLSRNLEHYKI